jgi:hypothetical protein
LALEGRLERIRRVADLGIAAGWPDDCDYIEARGRLGRSVASKIKLCGLRELLALFEIYLIFGSRIVIGASFYLSEDEDSAIPRDDVYLADFAFEISLDDFVPLIAQESGGDIFSALSERISRRRGREPLRQEIEHSAERLCPLKIKSQPAETKNPNDARAIRVSDLILISVF